jgi:Cu/Ag efflux protein CusF
MNRRQVAVAWALLAAVAAGRARAQAATAAGEVTKVDKEGKRVTLKHSGVKNLDMPPMTMAFRVRDPELLSDLAVGDRVRFVAERIDGQYTVTALTRAP